MHLHGEKLSKSMKLRTIDGKEMRCITVVAACIEHIKEKATDRIKQMIKHIDDVDIHWVLTVPAVWSEQARQFMIKAAEKTGIDIDNLSLALGPECAAVYYRHDELVKDEYQRNSALQSFRPGSKFMVVDLGGGTVDITVSEILESGKMKEISKASGGKWGGDTINKKIVDVLNDIFRQHLQRLRSEEINSYLELLADIESAKREYDEDDDFALRLPEFLQKHLNVGELANKFGNNIVIGKGEKYILFSQEMMKGIFKKCISDITKHIFGLLQEAKGVSEIILVGGYASSPIVQTAFKEEFGQKFKLIIPQNPEIVVLTGAVISGHSNEPITGRVAKYNYGLGIRASVDPGDRNLLLGNDRHQKIFHLLIEKGRRMDVGKYVESCKIKVNDSNQLDSIELYITKNDNPEHEININDFTKIGTIKFKLPKLRKPTTFTISLWYDETEFRVIAEDENTNLHFEGIIQYFE
ncbi:heat shock 70 kDa protein 12A-like [Mytilus galloprovincialis]|uniref:heat shock 70 kDa protein 12A-like n=1 Tax=Mytilus galloprovincialis TaxID=29158 RepID=UPI003F7B43D1